MSREIATRRFRHCTKVRSLETNGLRGYEIQFQQEEQAMRVLVSGGSRGIGAALCLRIAEAALSRGERPKIAVCGREASEPQEEIARSVREMGGDAVALSGDVGNIDSAAKLVDAAVSEFGGLDALVANAGVASPGSIYS